MFSESKKVFNVYMLYQFLVISQISSKSLKLLFEINLEETIHLIGNTRYNEQIINFKGNLIL